MTPSCKSCFLMDVNNACSDLTYDSLLRSCTSRHHKASKPPLWSERRMRCWWLGGIRWWLVNQPTPPEIAGLRPYDEGFMKMYWFPFFNRAGSKKTLISEGGYVREGVGWPPMKMVDDSFERWYLPRESWNIPLKKATISKWKINSLLLSKKLKGVCFDQVRFKQSKIPWKIKGS